MTSIKAAHTGDVTTITFTQFNHQTVVVLTCDETARLIGEIVRAQRLKRSNGRKDVTGADGRK